MWQYGPIRLTATPVSAANAFATSENMSFVALTTYAARIAPALALIALLLLLWKSFVLVENQKPPPQEDKPPNASFWQCLLAAYLILLHIITASIPLRAFYALGRVISKTEEKAQDLSPFQSMPMQSLLTFAIIIPAYKEAVDTLSETLDVLASHPHAQACYDVRLPLPIIKNDFWPRLTQQRFTWRSRNGKRVRGQRPSTYGIFSEMAFIRCMLPYIRKSQAKRLEKVATRAGQRNRSSRTTISRLKTDPMSS